MDDQGMLDSFRRRLFDEGNERLVAMQRQLDNVRMLRQRLREQLAAEVERRERLRLERESME